MSKLTTRIQVRLTPHQLALGIEGLRAHGFDPLSRSELVQRVYAAGLRNLLHTEQLTNPSFSQSTIDRLTRFIGGTSGASGASLQEEEETSPQEITTRPQQRNTLRDVVESLRDILSPKDIARLEKLYENSLDQSVRDRILAKDITQAQEHEIAQMKYMTLLVKELYPDEITPRVEEMYKYLWHGQERTSSQ